VPKKVEQIDDYLFIDTCKLNNMKIGVNEMTYFELRHFILIMLKHSDSMNRYALYFLTKTLFRTNYYRPYYKWRFSLNAKCNILIDFVKISMFCITDSMRKCVYLTRSHFHAK